MKKTVFKFSLVLAGFISGMALLIGSTGIGFSVDIINDVEAGTLPQVQVKDQMVCHVGRILAVLNKNYSSRSLTCVKRSTQATHYYNNLAVIYAEGWIVVDINNADTWVFNK